MRERVILETGDERRNVVHKAVEALGDDFFERCRTANEILLKVNLVHHEYQLASTHVDAVRGVLDAIRPVCQTRVFVGDASYHGTPAAFRNFGYDRLREEYEQVELVDLNDDGFVDGYTVRADGSPNPIRRSKLATTADLKISLAPMKIDRDVGVSLALENWAMGTWLVPPRISAAGRVWARWPWLHGEGAWAHHRTIMELYRQKPCDYAVVDGMMAMEGDGPARGTAVSMGLVVAGEDTVAVDAVSTALMGIDAMDIGYLAMCDQEGLGVADLGKIDVPPMLMHELRRSFAQPAQFEHNLRAWKEGVPQNV